MGHLCKIVKSKSEGGAEVEGEHFRQTERDQGDRKNSTLICLVIQVIMHI
jgi:hypothetical protein